MKKVYILIRGNNIEFVSSNLKSCYENLKDSLRPMEIPELLSYCQMTRRFKKVNKYLLITQFGTVASIMRMKVWSSYDKMKAALNN